MNPLLVEHIGQALEFAGVALLVAGLLFAFVRALRAAPGPVRYERARQDLGRAILLGLEVLVAADIVRSVTLAPTLDSLAVLAALVSIRTFLSWSLGLELEGRWPWQRPNSHPTLTPETPR